MNLRPFNLVAVANWSHPPGALGPLPPSGLPDGEGGGWVPARPARCVGSRALGPFILLEPWTLQTAPPAIWWLVWELQGLEGEQGSCADPRGAGPFTGSLPCSGKLRGSPVPQCHSLSPGLSHPHQPGQAPWPPVYLTLCSFCPDLFPPPKPLPSVLSVRPPFCSQGSGRCAPAAASSVQVSLPGSLVLTPPSCPL